MRASFAFPIDYIADPDNVGAIGLGSLYIGVVDGDPANNPADQIQVYIARHNDTDLAITQPIALSNGGIPLHNGVPATLKIETAYSCVVLNNLGNQVYYSSRSGEEIEVIEELQNSVQILQASKIVVVNTFAELALTEANVDMVRTKGHTVEGIGSLIFFRVPGSISNNGGTTINSATPGFYWQAMRPAKPGPDFFGGRVSPNDDQAIYINLCTQVYGECYLQPGFSYNITTTVKPLKLFCDGGVAYLECVSPTNDGRFGSLSAAVYAFGAEGSPLEGVDLQNITINCNKLIGATGSVGIKGFMLQRLKNFYQRGCKVINCASYAFWDYDTAITGTTYCSGTRDDCWAVDCAVSFEQVNVRGVTLNNCHGYISSAPLGYVPECIFHCYGGEDMQLVYNNCTGIADGVCPAVLSTLFEVKNFTVNSCKFLNNFNAGGGIQGAVYFDAAGSSNFDRIAFNNCELKSTYSAAVTVTAGSSQLKDNTFTFTNCKIDGYQVGVSIGGNGGRYYFIGCDTKARAAGTIVPITYYKSAEPQEVQVIGGFAKASTTGAATPLITNMLPSIFIGTTLEPAGVGQPKVRQRLIGVGELSGDGATYVSLSVALPNSVLGWTSFGSNTAKITVSINVDAGLSGAASLANAVAMAKPFSFGMPGNKIVRFYGDPSLSGKKVRYEITEWE